MDIRDIIAKKRDGEELSSFEIETFVSGCADDSISDAQVAALLMAIFLREMSIREIADLTVAMANSGEHPDLSGVRVPTVDKHSTGGVGDKTTLVVAPLVAALGIAVPKISGRSLAHTGGTLDKIECVPGLTTALSPGHFSRQVAAIGVAIAAQTAELAPADRKIYALRDLTGTVGSMALGISSIMSKKLAIGADAIVLDVKVGREADIDDSRNFAKTMVAIGTRCKKRTVALLTRMEDPIGRAVGDAAELVEAIETLGGEAEEDVAHLCSIVSGHMLAVAGVVADPAEGARKARQALGDGRGLEKFRELVKWQNGDPSVVDEPGALLKDCVRTPVLALREGYVTEIDAPRIGGELRNLKAEAGASKGLCGALIHKKTGHSVTAGEELATILSPAGLDDGAKRFADEIEASYTMGDQLVSVPGILREVVEG